MAKTLKIIKDNEQYKPGKFSQFSKKGFNLAAQKLNRYGLLLWMYLCSNKNDYTFTLSPTAIANEMGVSINVAKSMTKATGGIKELEDAGFIVGDNFYAEGCPDAEEESSEKEAENSPQQLSPAQAAVAAFNF